jgi:hypothetical protein
MCPERMNLIDPTDQKGNIIQPVDTDGIILKICNKDLTVPLDIHDIGRSHPIGEAKDACLSSNGCRCGCIASFTICSIFGCISWMTFSAMVGKNGESLGA